MNRVGIFPENWKKVIRDGLSLIKMKCPACGEWQDLMDHAIDENGRLTPSVICGGACGFHAMVTLENFKR